MGTFKEKQDVLIHEIETAAIPFFKKGVLSIYEHVKKTNKVKKYLLKEFQHAIKNIKNWTDEVKDLEWTRIRNSTNKNIDKMIEGVFKIYGLILYGLSDVFERMNESLPGGKEFIYECYLNIARELWRDPYSVYDIGLTEHERHKQLKSLDELIKKCMRRTFVDMIKFDPDKLNEVIKSSVQPIVDEDDGDEDDDEDDGDEDDDEDDDDEDDDDEDDDDEDDDEDDEDDDDEADDEDDEADDEDDDEDDEDDEGGEDDDEADDEGGEDDDEADDEDEEGEADNEAGDGEDAPEVGEGAAPVLKNVVEVKEVSTGTPTLPTNKEILDKAKTKTIIFDDLSLLEKKKLVKKNLLQSNTADSFF